MDDFEQMPAAGEADPFGVPGDSSEGFDMAAPPLDGGEADSGFAAPPIGGEGGEELDMSSMMGGGGDVSGGDIGGGLSDMGGMGGMGGLGGMGGDEGGASNAGGGFSGGFGGGFGEGETGSAIAEVVEAPRISEASLSAIAKWRLEHTKMVEEKQQREDAKQTEMRDGAKADLENVFKDREAKKAKRMIVNREEQAQAQQQRDASSAEDGPAVWNQVGLICDLKEKAHATVDTTRMRTLLVQLKHSS